MNRSEIVEELQKMLVRVMKYPLLSPEEEEAVEAAIIELDY